MGSCPFIVGKLVWSTQPHVPNELFTSFFYTYSHLIASIAAFKIALHRSNSVDVSFLERFTVSGELDPLV